MASRVREEKLWAALGLRWADTRGKNKETGPLWTIEKGGASRAGSMRYWVFGQMAWKNYVILYNLQTYSNSNHISNLNNSIRKIKIEAHITTKEKLCDGMNVTIKYV
jgi:hypothetical protein